MDMDRRPRVAPNCFSGSRIDQAQSVALLPPLVSKINLHPRTRGIDLADIARIGMTPPCRPHRLPIMVDRGRTNDDFVAPVLVDIRDLHAVRALARVFLEL